MVETVTTTATTVPPLMELLGTTVSLYLAGYLDQMERLPGGSIVQRYIRLSYRNDPLRSVFEFALFIFGLFYFFRSKQKENKKDLVKLSPREVDELIDDWEPQPLVEPVGDLERWRMPALTVKGLNSDHVQLEGADGTFVNLASRDMHSLNSTELVRAAAKSVIATAGVGACGPPNFYGTQDVHVRLEEDLARFLGTHLAILYGQDLVTAGLVIPAFLKRGDLAVVDLGVNMAIQKALIVSRCDIEWFDHNDMDHLERVLLELAPMLAKQKTHRRFIITEGLFEYLGDLAPVPRLVELKNRFKYRLFLDESLSIGAVGPTGRGVAELFGVDRTEIAITIGLLAGPFSSLGGFCAGPKAMVYHQRINSVAYVFSAALPPYLAKVVLEVIRKLDETLGGESRLIAALKTKVDYAYAEFGRSLAQSPYLCVASDPRCPIVHLELAPALRERVGFPPMYGNRRFLTTGKPARRLNAFSDFYNAECYVLHKIGAVCLRNGFIVARTQLVYEQENLPVRAPRLLVHVNAGVSQSELAKLAQLLPAAAEEVCALLAGPHSLDVLEAEMERVPL